MSRRPSLFWRRLSLQAWRTSPCGVASRCAAVYPHGAGTGAFRDREADGFRFAVAQNILPGLVPGCPAWDRQQDRMENYISNRIPATIRTQSSVPTNMPLMHPVAGFRALFGDLNILLLPFVSRKSRSGLRR